MDSFLDYGCWLRPIIARNALSVIESNDSSHVRRLAALMLFYQTAGQSLEDTITTYIAWSQWSLEKERKMSDVLSSVHLRFSKPDKELPRDYVRWVSDQLRKKSTVHVYAREYLKAVADCDDEEVLPGRIGVVWKRCPSVKLVAKEHREFWDGMGVFIRDTLKTLSDEKGALLAMCYNKIKHGPQLVVTSMREAALERGFGDERAKEFPEEAAIRLLLDGSRVHEADVELTNGLRRGPFLICDKENIRRCFFQQIVSNAVGLFRLGTWLYNSNRLGEKRPVDYPGDAEVRAVVRQANEHDSATQYSPQRRSSPATRWAPTAI